MLSPQYKPIVGGYERAAERLSRRLAARGHEVTVVAERRDRRWPEREIQDGVEVRRLWCLYRPRLHVLTSLASFAAFLLRNGRSYDVWHIHQYGAHALLAIALSKLLRRATVLKLMSSGPSGLAEVVASIPFAPLAKRLLCEADAVVALTQETRKEALAFGVPPGRVAILGNGIDTQLFRPAGEEERLRLRSEAGVDATGLVLYVGRLSAEKNPDGLLRAWQLAAPRMPSCWRLVIIGDGPMKEQLAAQARSLQLSEAVLFAGHQKNVEAWMAAADIYVLPSHYEGLSNTTLEAMSAGLPVISTRVSGSLETVGATGAGIVVDVGREDQLAGALVMLAHDPLLREQMGAAGRKVVETRFSIDHVSSQYEQLYLGLLRKPGLGFQNSCERA